MRILFPLPSRDFDPTESSVPWRALVDAGHEVVFATPDGQPAAADPRIVTGRGFALWRPFLRAVPHARTVYTQMATGDAFQHPLTYDQLDPDAFDGVVLTGGHAPNMKPYLESSQVQALVAQHMIEDKPVGALCHGVLVVARARDPETGRSVLHGRKTTALTSIQERMAWAMTGLWLGSYYRTYTQTVQAEVTQALASADDFETGPFLVRREGPERRDYGFTLRDRNYLSARYYTDAYKFADDFVALVAEHAGD
ncbi:type 1 glutamine amidotransferase domain-containing protein [Enhygromyxa salina]|uniref:DJ-1/PfpI family protein n=1 Tax=Enhygromyxa salina TaxID=215803 RepID=A0A2S9YRY0_9BACT|nr:type 1 glutamine amidotransferase domain-containing protein [Enhygromyxa salina]PRQ07853.1 DJ-1/PfpI family protein [Enhygromyxa salina]